MAFARSDLEVRPPGGIGARSSAFPAIAPHHTSPPAVRALTRSLAVRTGLTPDVASPAAAEACSLPETGGAFLHVVSPPA